MIGEHASTKIFNLAHSYLPEHTQNAFIYSPKVFSFTSLVACYSNHIFSPVSYWIPHYFKYGEVMATLEIPTLSSLLSFSYHHSLALARALAHHHDIDIVLV